MYLVMDCLFVVLGYVTGCSVLQSGISDAVVYNFSTDMTYDVDSGVSCDEAAVAVVVSATGIFSLVLFIVFGYQFNFARGSCDFVCLATRVVIAKNADPRIST